jgi:hypothetical protein
LGKDFGFSPLHYFSHPQVSFEKILNDKDLPVVRYLLQIHQVKSIGQQNAMVKHL